MPLAATIHRRLGRGRPVPTLLFLLLFLVAGCGATSEIDAVVTTTPVPPALVTAEQPRGTSIPSRRSATDAGSEATVTSAQDSVSETTTTMEPVSPSAVLDAADSAFVRPDWLGTRVLPTTPAGIVVAQTTPAELLRRELVTIDTMAKPTGLDFQASAEPLAGEPLARSTWSNNCPVEIEELSYLRITFWGFDGLVHWGEMIVNAVVANDVIDVFRQLYEQRFPIEEMRIVTPADVAAPPTGDGNNTTSFVCRAVVGGTTFSEHAYGLAIDINPFQNPYRKGGVVLPELASSYLDRADSRPGMHAENSPVVSAFDAIGWGWGGRWKSLDDYHHFALNNR